MLLHWRLHGAVNTDWAMVQMNHTKEMGLESAFDKHNMRTIWRGEETAVVEGKRRGGRGSSKRALGLLNRMQAGVVLECARQRNHSIVADVFSEDTATQQCPM